MNQSRPRRLWREAVAVTLGVAGSDTGAGTLLLPTDRPRRSPSIRSIEWDELANSIFVRLLVTDQTGVASGCPLRPAPRSAYPPCIRALRSPDPWSVRA